MEFYSRFDRGWEPVSPFQFPTGWNSTGTTTNRYSNQSGFQFPTGWNSTLRPEHSPQLGMGFNSQRDGILPDRFITASSVCVRFNSQRDGILLKLKQALRYMPYVSIPNGMEFYCKILGNLHTEPEFQFPTGWNSTRSACDQTSGREEFQFPTGWNSTLIPFSFM